MSLPRIADFPGSEVRIACRLCDRRGLYRAERLLERYGSGLTFAQLLAALGQSCRAGEDRKPGPCSGPYVVFPVLPQDDEGRDRDWRGQTTYECVRSVRDHRTHVICGEGTFEALPQTVRSCGPWNGSRCGDMAALRPEYRALIEAQGFVVVYAAVTIFRPEG